MPPWIVGVVAVRSNSTPVQFTVAILHHTHQRPLKRCTKALGTDRMELVGSSVSRRPRVLLFFLLSTINHHARRRRRALPRSHYWNVALRFVNSNLSFYCEAEWIHSYIGIFCSMVCASTRRVWERRHRSKFPLVVTVCLFVVTTMSASECSDC